MFNEIHTVEELKAVLDYNPLTGLFAWKIAPQGRIVGQVAGSKTERGYYRLCVDGVRYKAHRVAIAFVEGKWPTELVDHKDRNNGDNRYSEIRHANSCQNQANATIRKDNTSGYKGVSFHKKTKKWSARITVNKMRIQLGLFNTPEEAHAAYITVANKRHKEFARAK